MTVLSQFLVQLFTLVGSRVAVSLVAATLVLILLLMVFMVSALRTALTMVD